MKRKQIFISSVQKEFEYTRDKLASFINNDPYWSQFFYAFIFENLPASQRSPSDIYLNEIDKCTIYLGVFGIQYGKLYENGISATEQEFDYAIEIGRDPLIFIKKLTSKAQRAKRMQALYRKPALIHTLLSVTLTISYARFREACSTGNKTKHGGPEHEKTFLPDTNKKWEVIRYFPGSNR